MEFNQCVLECAKVPEFVDNFDRLSGTNLMRRGSFLDIKIDDATGRAKDDMGLFCAFVYEFVWTRIDWSNPSNKLQPQSR